MGINVAGVELVFERGLWVGLISSSFGQLEVLVDGDASGPREDHIEALRHFLPEVDERVRKLRRTTRFPSLYRPIRIAPNSEGRVGVQFRHRLTHDQSVLVLDD